MHMTDSIGRSWQLGTVQLDYNMPKSFELSYTGADNTEHQPVMIHRALFGSYERFLGIMIEHYGGEFPLWLAPVQAIVLPISERLNDYAETVRERLRAAGVRVELDDRGESIGRKIREAELRKIPNMLIVGDREAESDSVSLRTRMREGHDGEYSDASDGNDEGAGGAGVTDEGASGGGVIDEGASGKGVTEDRGKRRGGDLGSVPVMELIERLLDETRARVSSSMSASASTHVTRASG
jgi:hypothetical protein